MICHCGSWIFCFLSPFTGHLVLYCINYDKSKDRVLLFCLQRYQQMMQSLKNSISLAVESLINKCKEDQRKKAGLVHDRHYIQSSSQYNCNNCSDSDSSFNQVNFPLYYTQHISDSVNLIGFHRLLSCFITSFPECYLH